MSRARPLLTALVALALLTAVPAAPSRGVDAEPLQHLQWALDNIEAPAAWDVATGSGVVAAVIDNGVAPHPELEGRFHPDSASWWGCGDRPVPCSDGWNTGRHGLHVTGVLAAARDGVGMAGVAPDVEIMALRAVGGGDVEDILQSIENTAEAIRYATDHGADVINISLGGPVELLPPLGVVTAYYYEWGEAVKYALDHGVFVAVAAGNGYEPLCENLFLVEGADALCVGAVDRDDFHRWDSGWGLGVDLVAPGGQTGGPCDDVLTTESQGNVDNCDETPVGYVYFGATSAATPHVTGVAALLAEEGVRGREAADRILQTADDLGVAGPDPLYGHGRVNAARALDE